MPANGWGHGSTWRSGCTKQRGITIIPAFTNRAAPRQSGSTGAFGKASTRATARSSRPWPHCEYARTLAEFNANNALALRKLRGEGTVKILKFDESLLKAFLAVSSDVVAEIGARDELSRKIYASYQEIRASMVALRESAERACRNRRSLE